VLQDDFSLVVYSFSDEALWASGTSRSSSDMPLLLLTDDYFHVPILDGNEEVWTLDEAGRVPAPTCIGSSAPAGQVFEKNTMLCRSIDESEGRFGLDSDGRVVEAVRSAAADDDDENVWTGQFHFVGTADRAIFQDSDGNFVAYKDGKAVWSTRTGTDFPYDERIKYRKQRNLYLGFEDDGGETRGWRGLKPFYQRGERLTANQKLYAGEYITKFNKSEFAGVDHRFGVDYTGELNIWVRGRQRRRLFSDGNIPNFPGEVASLRYDNYLTMQDDGNLVFRNSDYVVWTSKTGGNPGAYAAINQDGSVTIHRSDDSIIKVL